MLGCRVYSPGHGGAGICLVGHLGPYRVMLDCGLSRLDPYFDLTPPADWVICSHAHPNHARGMLALHRGFPDLPIYTSEVTRRLLPLNWPVEEGLTGLGIELPWRLPVHLAPDLTVELIPAGHLPGAALVWLQYQTPERVYSLLYTGNCCLANTRLAEGLRLEELRGLHPDVLILDAPAGTRKYPRRKQQEHHLAEWVVWALTRGQRVCIVAGAIGDAQEILLILRTHYLLTGRPVRIGVDPAVARGCDVLLELLAFLPTPVQNFARHQSLFWDDRVYPQSHRWQPSEAPDPFDILLCSDLPDCIGNSDQRWWVLWPEEVPLPREVPHQTYRLSAYNDSGTTLQLLHTLRPQHLVLVHGLPHYLGDLAGLEEVRNRYHVHVPLPGAWLDLPVGSWVRHPAPEPAGSYEGEIQETPSGIRIELPRTLTADPRWQPFSTTGLVEARWQGEELVLRGLTPKEVLAVTPTPGRACAHCRFYRGQRCTQPESPLMGLQVAPDGYCDAFTPAT